MKDTNLVAVVMTKVSIADGGYQNHFVCEAPNYDANKVYKDVLKYKKKVLDDYNKEFLDLVGRMEEDEVATGS